jgi:hypothetical protein
MQKCTQQLKLHKVLTKVIEHGVLTFKFFDQAT